MISENFNKIRLGRMIMAALSNLSPFYYPQVIYNLEKNAIEIPGVRRKKVETTDIAIMMVGEYMRIGLFVYGLTHPNHLEAVAIGVAISSIGMLERIWARNISADMYADALKRY